MAVKSTATRSPLQMSRSVFEGCLMWDHPRSSWWSRRLPSTGVNREVDFRNTLVPIPLQNVTDGR